MPVLILSSVRRGVAVAVACHRTIFLDRMPATDCETLIKAIASSGEMPRAIVAELIDRSDGVPLSSKN